ncbi:MAG: flagellin FliC3 [Lachnospiraceae bacterium]|jgi:flagellin|nr:flagellin FliC3 [Lachnospiraceae bacterium]
MKISYNAAAMRANYALNKSDKRLTTSLKRLSSGLKVTAAKENPSGYAIGRRMNAQIGGISVATQNSNNGISIIETADGALTEVHDMLQRMNELAVKGATGTLTSVDRETLNKELKQLKEEVARVANDTEFNGQALLDGSFEMRGYTNSQVAKVDYYTDEVLAKEYTISQLEVFYNDEGEIDLDQTKASFGLQAGDGFPEDAEVATVGQDKVTIKGGQGFELTIQVKPPTAFPGSVDCSGIVLDITGIGAMDTQIGANEGQQLAIRIPTISLNRLGIEQTDVSTEESSSDAITEVKGAIKYVSDVRSRLGAYQNRLEHTISSLDISKENMTASYSRIMDVDMAEEMTNYTTEQVISQASVSMVAQANERPSQVLQLLQ